MKVYENPRVAAWATKKVIARLERGEPDGRWHAHDIFRCLRHSYLSRLHPTEPDQETMMRWALGYAMQEYFLGPEADSDEWHGILFSTDHRVGDDTLEFKTTTKSYEKFQKDGTKYLKDLPKVRFDPTENEHWVERLRGYCAFRGKPRAHILVYFIHQKALHAWTFEFDRAELDASADIAELNRTLLDSAWERQSPPPVTTRLGPFECAFCPYYIDHCAGELQRLGLPGTQEEE